MIKKRNLILISSGALIILLLMKCDSAKDRSINYLNQNPPGMEAKLFAPGIISTNNNEHSSLAFSPDGNVVLWAVMDRNYRGRLLEMKFKDGTWSGPASPSFADTTSDDYAPSFSPDGKKLFFCSRRNYENYPGGNGNRIWVVDYSSEKWGIPTPIDTTISNGNEFSHSVSNKGTLFFSTLNGKDLNIYRADLTDNTHRKPISLPDGINTTGYEDGPYISPNETFLIFESTRPEGIEGSHDLYITFKKENGEWGKPINLGPKINSTDMERFPVLSPDGKYLFFASNRDQSNGKVGFDFYWIDAKVIADLK